MKHLITPGFHMKETQPYGDIFFPCNYYDSFLSVDFSFLPIHWHEEMEITWIRKGACVYQIDFHPFPVKENDLLILPPRTLHGIQEQENQNAKMQSDTFVFHLNFLGLGAADVCSIRYLSPIDAHAARVPLVIHPGSPGHAALCSTFLQLMECHKKKEPCFELEIKSKLLHFLYILCHDVGLEASRQDTSISAAKNEKIRLILSYIEEHYEEAIPVQTLASLCGFSEYHFMRFFKKCIGQTVTGYINSYRVSTASRLLMETDQPITEIALSSGFNNISYFNRVFKEHFHMTPKDFRKNNMP